jgi:hypothetical protein
MCCRSVVGPGREGGNAGSDDEVWAHPIIKLAVIAAPVHDLPTRYTYRCFERVSLLTQTTATKAQDEEHQTLDESSAATWRSELCACSRRMDEVHS